MEQANKLGSSEQGSTIMNMFMKAMRGGAGGQLLAGAGGEAAANVDKGIQSIMDAVAGEGAPGAQATTLNTDVTKNVQNSDLTDRGIY